LNNQLRQTLRRLRRAPMFTGIALITLAVGIGANTAVFTVVEGVLLKPLPYPHPDQLVGIWHVAPGLNLGDVNMAPSNYFIYREQNRTFQDLGLYGGDSVSITGSGEPEQVRALLVTDGLLPVLGISPMLGRWFSRTDGTPGAPDTVILTYGYWQRKFGSDRSIVGRTITADGKLRQIIGVTSPNFQFLDWETPALILPLTLDRNKTTLGQFSYEGIARLKPGITLAAANSDVARMIPTVWASFPTPPGFSPELFKKARLGPNVRPLMRDVVGDVGKLLWILMGSIGMVLLIACANVANLLLVRAEGRQQELAIRAALGSSRSRIVRDFLLESIVLGTLGGVLGLALAYGALRLLVAIAPAGLPRIHHIGINLPVLAFALLVSLLASLLSGLVPTLRYSGAHMGTALREGGRSQSQGRERHRTRNGLVVVQVCLAFVLLICSGLMFRTFRALTQLDPGFSLPAEVQTLRLTIPQAEVKDDEKVVRMQQAIADKIKAIQGVSSVGLESSVPMDGGSWNDPVFAQDRNYAEGEMPPLRRFKFSSPGLFHTLGIPLIAGRDFSWAETYQKLPVAIVSENFAREYWGRPVNALGKQIRVGSKDDWHQIIGVVGDVRDDGLNKDAPTIAYWPIYLGRFESDLFHVSRTLVFAIRSPRAGSESLMKEVRPAVWSIDSNLPLENIRTLDYYSGKSMARTSFTLVMLTIAGSMALVLGLVGLYGVIAYSVSQRTREIGIRIALGAQRKNITGMFLQQGLLLAGAGAACGILVALGVTRFLSSLLFHVRTVDPVTYISACLGLAIAAALASYIPSRSATAVDPVEALRAE
jgi:predicted permease